MVIAPPASRYIPVISQLISSFKNPRDPQLKKNILQRRQAKISPDDLHFLNTIWHPMKFHDQPWSTTISTMINHDQPWYKSLSTIISTGAHLSGISGISRPRSGYRQPGEGEEQAFMYQWGSGARGAMGAMNRGDANSAFGGAFPNSARWFRWWTKTMTEFRIENGWKWPSRNSWFTL